MRRLIKISVFSALLASSQTFAAEKNCMIVIVGGAKEWLSLGPGVDTDISILVDRAARAEARRTGCKIITGQNQTQEEFRKMMKEASENYRPGMTVHMALTDHGTPQPPDGNNGNLYIGKMTSIPHKDLAAILKESFPKGSRLTFSSSICWGSMSEMSIHQKLDSHFDICGSASTHPHFMSYNVRSMQKTGSQVNVGAYVPTALSFSADALKRNLRAPSVDRVHQVVKDVDVGNKFRMPGLISSTSYARHVLLQKGVPAEVDRHPLDAILDADINLQKVQDMLKKFSAAKLQDDLADILQNGEQRCTLVTDPDFHSFVRFAAGVIKKLSTQIPLPLEEPYRTRTISAANWIGKNRGNLPKILTDFFKAKMEFWASRKEMAMKPEFSKKLKEEWKEYAVKIKGPLAPFLYQSRIIQEGRTISDFLAVANKDEKARFNKFVACESRPLL